MQEATEILEAFELASQEIEVCLRIKGPRGRHQLFHYLRPTGLDDWWQYERDLKSTVESIESDGEQAMRFVSNGLEAAVALYDRIFQRAEGYIAQPDQTTTAAQIPVDHKELVIRALADVAKAADETEETTAEDVPYSLDAETVIVELEAGRNGKKHGGLMHIFRTPTAADRVEYSRIHAQALYVRGSKTLKSILPSRLPGLAALYDRLIERVEGYAVDGKPLADRAVIQKHMDPLHKKTAVQLLFGE